MITAKIPAVKSAVEQAIEARRDAVVGLARRVYADPEAGFEEVRTSRLVADALTRLGLPVQRGIALTGLKAVLRFPKPGPTVALLGELDSLRVPRHPGANRDTGAAHACGHHAQLGALLGAAIGLRAVAASESLSGSVAFMATPAEEFIDVARRWQRRQAGELELMSGKQEMIRRGAFDDVDMAMMVHTNTEPVIGRFALGGTSNAHVVHYVKFLGRAAHAGGAPFEGVNALQAANVALSAINAQRETFQDEDAVRVHGIVTEGGTAVNSVPAEVVYEGRVRGRSSAVVDRHAARVERCFEAGALAMGATVEIVRIAGYLPLRNDPVLEDIFARNASALYGERAVTRRESTANPGGSTDMGDLSQIMPAIHPYVGAATGAAHGADYLIRDYDAAVVAPAKVMAATVIDLLADGASGARAVIAACQPALSKGSYLRAQEERMRVIRYRGA